MAMKGPVDYTYPQKGCDCNVNLQHIVAPSLFTSKLPQQFFFLTLFLHSGASVMDESFYPDLFVRTADPAHPLSLPPPTVPLPCHPLLMSLSVTRRLPHRLDVINLLKDKCPTAAKGL